jgi:hypothetical protein
MIRADNTGKLSVTICTVYSSNVYRMSPVFYFITVTLSCYQPTTEDKSHYRYTLTLIHEGTSCVIDPPHDHRKLIFNVNFVYYGRLHYAPCVPLCGNIFVMVINWAT